MSSSAMPEYPSSPAPSSFELGSHPRESEPVGWVQVAQLQGVMMAVFGVSASAAIRALRRHSFQQHASMVGLAAAVMSSIDELGSPVTPDVLRALLARTSYAGSRRGYRADPSWPRPPQPRALARHLAVAEPAGHGRGMTDELNWERVGLSRREAQALHLIAQGMSNQDIASAMFVTVNTVKSYIRTAYQKMGVHTRAQAVRWALVNDPAYQRQEGWDRNGLGW